MNSSKLLLTGGIVVLVLGVAGCGGNSVGTVLTDNLSQTLNGATTSKVDINSGTGHLTIDKLAGGDQLLASGTLEYLETQGRPARNMGASDGAATLTLTANAAKQAGFSFPWTACWGGAYEWEVHLNPVVPTDITASCAGGNVKLDLTGMAVTRVSADTDGGNMDVILPDNASGLNVKASAGAGNVNVDVGNGITGSNTVDASSGAGNVAVRIPSGTAVRVHATSGVGKVIVDARFINVDKDTYQSSDYDSAANKVDITVKSGAGDVNVNTK